MSVVKDEDGNIIDLNYDTFESTMEDRIAGLRFTSEMRTTLKTIFHNGDIKKNLRDKTTRLKVREELNRLLMNAKQYSDMSYDGTNPQRLQSRRDAKNNLAY